MINEAESNIVLSQLSALEIAPKASVQASAVF